MRKTLKIVLWSLGGLIAIVLVAVLALPLWIGPVATGSANAYMPRKLGVGFHIDSFHLNPYVGKLTVGKVELDNPQGYNTKEALTIGNFVADLDPMSLLGEVIVIDDLALEDFLVVYENGPDGVNNFDEIFITAGWKYDTNDKFVSKDELEKREAAARKKVAEKQAKGEAKAEGGESKRLIIDHLLIRNVRVKIHGIPVKVPDLELSNLGRNTNGITASGLLEQIGQAVLEKLSGLVGGIQNIGKLGLDFGAKGLDVGAKQLQNGMDVLNKQSGKLTEQAGKLTEQAGAIGKQAGDAVKQAGDAVKKLGNLFK